MAVNQAATSAAFIIFLPQPYTLSNSPIEEKLHITQALYEFSHFVKILYNIFLFCQSISGEISVDQSEFDHHTR